MTSKPRRYDEAFAWVWLPGAVAPVVAGRLHQQGMLTIFNYGRSYLALPGGIPLYLPELPLQAGELQLLDGLSMPGCLRDAASDAWGRRVILNALFGIGRDDPGAELPELAFLLESSSDRVGGLDFQRSPTEYQPRFLASASLEELAESTGRLEKGLPLSPELAQALLHGSSIGGARPKALIESGAARHVAKFSSSSDYYSVVKAEFVAMRLAALAGIDAAPVLLAQAAGKDVLLVERFDRIPAGGDWLRRLMVSALTVLGLDEMFAGYASYQSLAEIIRHRFTDPAQTLRELFSRITFNVLCGNTDDHARNHAAFWDGSRLTLTPAYDICPQGRTGQEATQAMLIDGNDRRSQIATCIQAARHFLLSEAQAIATVEHQLRTMARHWRAVCDEAGLGVTERRLFWGRQFLNPYAFHGLSGAAVGIAALADEIRGDAA